MKLLVKEFCCAMHLNKLRTSASKRTPILTRYPSKHSSRGCSALPLPTTKPLAQDAARGEHTTRAERDDSEARYSLIISLHVPETNVDLLTPVQLKVDALIASQIEIPS
jgi:hypothetical protein